MAVDTPLTTRTIGLPTGDFAIVETGEGGRPLLLVHGFTGAKEDFADHVGWLADGGWHVVAPDLRGHGASPKPSDESSYSMKTMAADLVHLVDALEWDRLVLLGHSMGGMIAQVFAIEHRHRLDGLILMDTNHGTFDLEPEIAALGAELARTEGMPGVKAVLDTIDDPLGNPAFDRMVAERPGYQEYSDAKFLSSSPAMYASLLIEITTAVSRLDGLRSLRVPTAVLVGELDTPFLQPSRELAASISGASLTVLPDGGHSPQFESPEAWADAVRTFLSGL